MIDKPLPDAVISDLRKETYAGGNPVWEVARIYYKKGLEGTPFEYAFQIDAQPPFPADMVEIFERFLRACFEQGRKDAK